MLNELSVGALSCEDSVLRGVILKVCSNCATLLSITVHYCHDKSIFLIQKAPRLSRVFVTLCLFDSISETSTS